MKRILFVLVLTVIFCAFVMPSYAEQKVEIKDGAIHFPEKDGVPAVELSKLNLRFPADCPPELLGTKGKIFRGELTKQINRRSYTLITYLIPLSYNSDSKEVTFFIVQDKGFGKEYESKSAQGWLRGPLDVKNGSVLKWVMRAGTNIMTQDYKLTFLKNGNLRVDRSDGLAGDYSVAGSLPDESQKSDTPQ